MLTAAAALFIVYVLLLAGIFSYFHSEDRVTNRLDAKSGDVQLLEPKWDSTGQYQARASEPGMQIEKDPSGYNNGQVDLYIRLRMTVTLHEFETDSNRTAYNNRYDDSGTSDQAIQNAKRRLNLILHALTMENGTPLFDMTTVGTLDTWTVNSCNNPNFVLNTCTENGTVYYDFYYTGDNTENKMKKRAPEEKTADLFNYVNIPVYKADWLGVFDQKYDITLTAEGIPAANYPEDLPVQDDSAAKDAVRAFQENAQ